MFKNIRNFRNQICESNYLNIMSYKHVYPYTLKYNEEQLMNKSIKEYNNKQIKLTNTNNVDDEHDDRDDYDYIKWLNTMSLDQALCKYN